MSASQGQLDVEQDSEMSTHWTFPSRIAFSYAFIACLFTQCFPSHCGVFAQSSETATPASASRGRELFRKVWTEQGTSRQTETTAEPDGLGPLFNADSCVACHNLNGVGGAGDNSTNVLLLSVLPRHTSKGKHRLDEQAVKSMFFHAKEIHSSLSKTNTVVLHRSSTDPASYVAWQNELLGFKTRKNATEQQVIEKFAKNQTDLLSKTPIFRVRKSLERDRFTIQVSRRNTPSLFGAGLIELIPDKVIREIANRQANSKGPVKGQLAKTANNEIGKFGWRGEKSSIRQFTIEACAVELGLSNKSHLQASVPHETGPTTELGPSPFDEPPAVVGLEPIPESPPTTQREYDVSEQEIADLIQFITELPPPEGARKALGKDHDLGEALLDRINCTQCHVRQVGHLAGIYSDFLLHDMGSDLADAAGAINIVRRRFTVTDEIQIKDAKLWQTPPLWDVGSSAPYLHDGRAPDIDTAIKMHGGEASESVSLYRKLKPKDKQRIVAFLKTLGAKAERPFSASGGWSSSTQSRGILAGRHR